MAIKQCPKCKGQLVKDADKNEYVCSSCGAKFRITTKTSTNTTVTNKPQTPATSTVTSTKPSVDTSKVEKNVKPEVDTTTSSDELNDLSLFDSMFTSNDEEDLSNISLDDFDSMFASDEDTSLSDISLDDFDSMFASDEEDNLSDISLDDFDSMFTSNEDMSDIGDMADFDSMFSSDDIEDFDASQIDLDDLLSPESTAMFDDFVQTKTVQTKSAQPEQEDEEENTDIPYEDDEEEPELNCDLDYIINDAKKAIRRNNKDVAGFFKVLEQSHSAHPNCSTDDLISLSEVIKQYANSKFMVGYSGVLNNFIAKLKLQEENAKKQEELNVVIKETAENLENSFTKFNPSKYKKADYNEISNTYKKSLDKLNSLSIYDKYEEKSKEILKDFISDAKSVKTQAQRVKSMIIKISASAATVIALAVTLIIGAQPKLNYEVVDSYEYKQYLSNEYDIQDSDIAKLAYSYNDSVVVVKGITGLFFPFHFAMKEVVIPEEVDGYRVVAIDSFAFYHDSNIEKVILPNSIVYIGESAFAYCYNLTEFGYNDTSSGQIAYNCLPTNTAYIGGWAFEATNIPQLCISNVVKSIGNGAFSSHAEGFTIQYAGTKDQWNDIRWEGYDSSSYIVFFDLFTIRLYDRNYNLYNSYIASSSGILTVEHQDYKGYEFKGYYTNNGKKIYDQNDVLVNNYTFTEDLHLYAEYDEIEYTVTYNAPGSNLDEQSFNYYISSDYIYLDDPIKTGYYFNGWYTDEEYTESIRYINPDLCENIEVYAKFTPNTYILNYNDYDATVLFNSNGGSEVATQYLNYNGASFYKPSDPVRDGYVFTGWYTDQSCTKYFDFNTTINSDILLYAGWMSNEDFYISDVSYYDSYSNPNSTYTYTVGEIYNRYSFIVENDGSSNAQIVYKKNGNSYSNFDIVIYNETTKKVINEVYNVSSTNSAYVYISDSIKKGDLISVYVRSSSTQTTYVTVTYTSLYDEYVYPSFRQFSSIDVIYDSSYKLDIINNVAGSFIGYYTEPNGQGERLTDNKGNSLGKYNFNYSITVYPYYDKTYSTITYYDGDKVIKPDEATFKYAFDEEIDLVDATKTGHTFIGWYDNAELNGTAITTIPKGNVGDKVYYAKFEANTYNISVDVDEATVTFNSNGGSSVSSQTLYAGDSIYIPTNPTKSGYVFTGWYTDQSCTKYYDFTNYIYGDLTLYAGWMANSDMYSSSTYDYKTIDPTQYTSSYNNYSTNIYSSSSQSYPYRFTFIVNETRDSSNPYYIYYRQYYGSSSSYNYYMMIYNETQNSTIKSNSLVSYSSSYSYTSFTANAGDVVSIYIYDYSSSTSTYIYFTNFNQLESTGTLGVSASATYGEEFEMDIIEIPGYKFNGYYTEENGEGTQITDQDGKSLAKYLYTEDIKVYSYYTETPYDITYDANGGETTDEYVYNYSYGDPDITLPTLTKTGYTFDGWCTDSELTSTPIMEIESGTYGNIKLYAKFTANTYYIESEENIFYHTVNFVTNGASDIDSQTLYYGNSISIPTAPTKSGYIFTGWYSDEECSEYYDFTDNISSDLTLYAGWISYDNMYNNNTYSYYTVDPTYYNSSSNYYYQSINYSSYSSNPYRINFVVNETRDYSNPYYIYYAQTYGSGSYYYYYMMIYNETQKTTIKSYGYVSYSSSYSSYSFTANAGDVISIYLYNYYNYYNTSASLYFSNFDNLESTGTAVDTTKMAVDYGSNYSIPVNEINGYTFNGYFTEENGQGSQLTDTDGNSLVAYSYTTDINIYPYYTMDTYTISYEKNNGVDADEDYEYIYSYTVEDSIELPTLTKTGYTFDGWCTDSELTSTPITEIEEGTYGDLTLYAKFTANTYYFVFEESVKEHTVTFDSNGGTTISSQTLDANESIVIPTNPSKSGYIFTGWYSDEECSEYYDFTDNISGDLTLYAGWMSNSDMYYTSLYDYYTIDPTYYNSSSNYVSQDISSSSSQTYPYRISFVINETRDSLDPYYIYYRQYYGSSSSYSYYMMMYNETQDTTISSYSYVSYSSYYSSVSFTANAGDVISIYLYDYSYSTYAYFYFYNFDSLESAGISVDNNYMEVEYGSSYSIPVTEYDGYTFNGYFTEEDGQGTQLTDTDGNSLSNYLYTTNTNVYPYYSLNTYTISYEKNNGADADEDYEYIYSYTVEDSFELPTLTMTGYTFNGWCTDSELTSTPITEIVEGTHTDLDLYAKFTINTYTITVQNATPTNNYISITYDYNYTGSTPTTVTKYNGDTLSAPSNPTRTGYVFEGWYTDSDCTTEYDFSGTISADLTLYANWTSVSTTNDYYYPWYVSGSSISSTNTAHNSYSDYTITAPVSMTMSFTYNTSSESGCDILRIYKNGSQVYSRSGTSSSDSAGSIYLEAGDYVMFRYSKDGSVNSGYDYAYINYLTYTSNRTYSQSATVDISHLGTYLYSAGSTVEKEVTYNTAYTISPMTREYYTFNGYYTEPNGQGTKITDSEGNPTSNYLFTTDIDAYPYFTGHSFTITYEKNNGVDTDEDYVYIYSYTGDDAFELPILAMTGYTFNGWCTDSELTSTPITEIVAGTFGNLTLYAKFTVSVYTLEYDSNPTCTVTFNSNGGTTIESQTLTYQQTISIPTNPTKSGYVFTGWYTDEACTQYYNFTNNITDDLTLYAGWMANSSMSYSSTYDYNTINPTQYNSSSNYYSQYVSSSSSSSSRYRISFAINETRTTSNPYYIYYKNNYSTSSNYRVYIWIYNETQDISIKSNGYVSSTTFTSVSFTANAGDVISIYMYDYNNYSTYAGFYFSNFNNLESIGVSTVNNKVSVTYNTGYYIPHDERTAYTFNGYYTEPNGEGTQLTDGNGYSLANYTFTNDIMAYSYYTPTSYTLTYETYGGTPTDSEYTYTNSYTIFDDVELPTLTKTGYVFDGWYNNPSYTGDAVTGINEGTYGDLTFYAKFTPNNYYIELEDFEIPNNIIVTFMNDGSNYSTQTLSYGSSISIPTNPSKSGYIFTGWYTDEACTQYYNFTSDIENGLTLYAGWESTSDMYYTSVYSSTVINPTAYTSSSYYTYTISSSSSSSNPYRINFVINETKDNTDPYYIYYRQTYGSSTSYRYYITVYNETTNTLIQERKLVDYSTTYSIASFAANAGDVISIYLYDYSSTTRAQIYFANFETLSSTGVSHGHTKFNVTYDASYSIPVVNNNGYTFNGYFTEANGEGTQLTDGNGNSIANYAYTANTSAYPYYTINNYTVTYNKNNGVEVDDSYEYIESYTILDSFELPELTKTGYTFNGWYTTEDFSGAPITEVVGLYTNLDLYAKFTANTYNITLNNVDEAVRTVVITYNYNYSGSTNSTVTKSHGDTLSAPANPTRNGYVFTGWYTDEACTTEYNFSGSITSDMTLYAKWAAVSVTNSSWSVSGSSLTSTNKTSNSSSSCKITAPVNMTVSFTYNTSSEATYDKLQIYKNSTLLYTKSGTGNSDSNATISLSTGDYIEFKYSKDGSVSTGSDCAYITNLTYSYDITYSDFATINTSNAKYLYTTGSTEQLTVTYDSSYLLDVCGRNGYTFVGWYTEENGEGTQLSDNTGIPTLNYTYADNINAYPHFTINTYTISYEKNGGVDVDEEYEYMYSYNVEDAFNLPVLSKTGYTFNGWYTTEDFSGDPITTISNSYTNLSLYAKFTINQYKVTLVDCVAPGDVVVSFNSNGGTFIESQILSVGNKITIPTAPTKSGYVFTGWYTDEACTQYYNFSSNITNDLTLYAGWMSNSDMYYSSTYSNVKINPTSYYSSSYAYNLSVSSESSATNRYRISFTVNETRDSSNPYYIYYRNSYSTSSSYRVYIMIYNETQDVEIKANAYVTSTSFTSVSFAANAGDVISIYAYDYSSTTSAAFYFYNFSTQYSTGVSLGASEYNITYNSRFSLPVLQQSGYEFVGYFTEANGEGTQITDEMGNSISEYTYTEDINLYPYYTTE